MQSGYFNEEQSSYLRHLASIPREQRCRCGWDRLGACANQECRQVFEEDKRLHTYQQDVMSDDGCPHHPHDEP